MLNYIPSSIRKVTEAFEKLPGIGNKTASRLTFYLLSLPKEEVEEFGRAILGLKINIKNCSRCYNISDQEMCPICQDLKRDRSMLAVVEHPLDVIAIEKTGEFRGLYHVLGGAISPVEGIGPEDLFVKELIWRVKQDRDNLKEIILATNPNLEGEATAMYLQKKLTPFKIKLTRIARGLPIGGDMEYADEMTLGKALEGRREVKE